MRDRDEDQCEAKSAFAESRGQPMRVDSGAEERRRREMLRMECLHMAADMADRHEPFSDTLSRAKAYMNFITAADDAVRDLRQRIIGAVVGGPQLG